VASGFAGGLGWGKTKVLHTFRFSESGYNYTYGAVALDYKGFIIVTLSRSNSQHTPMAVEAGMSPSGSIKFVQIIRSNVAGTTCGSGSNCDERWGDYLGAARDDTNIAQIYVASLYQQKPGATGWASVIKAATSAGVE